MLTESSVKGFTLDKVTVDIRLNTDHLTLYLDK